MLLFLLGSLNVWGEDYSHTFAEAASIKSASGTVTLSDVVWNFTNADPTYGSDTQIGSKKNPTSITLSTTFNGTVTQVKVTGYSYNGLHTYAIKIGGSTVQSGSTGSSSTPYIGTSTSNDGSVEIDFTKGSGSRALYLSKIEVTYTTGGVVNVASVALDKSAITLTEEDTQTLTATVLPDNATNKNVTWESNDEDIATVENGLVTAVGAGDATITCKSVADPTKFAECSVHVNPSPYTKSSLIFTAACEGSGTANDGVEWTVESDAAESNFDSNRGVHYGTSSKAVSYIVLTSAAFSDKIKKIEVEAAGSNTPSITVTVGGATFGEIATGITNSNVKYTFEPTPAQSATEFTGVIVVRLAKESSANGALYVKSVVVTYESDGKEAAGLAYDDSDLSNLVKLGGTFTAPTLTNPNSLSVTYTSSNTDVAEVAADGALTIKAVGVAEITASSAETETYKAGSAKYTIYVVAHDGTEADPYTVADARVIIDKVGETGIADKYAKGIVSEIVTAYNSQYGNISYNISDDGTTTAAQLQAFRGKGINGENFTSEDDIMVGDEVVVKGLLKKYNSTYEFDAENQLVSLNRSKEAAGLAYAETAVEKNIGDPAFTNTLTNPNGLTVTYSSSDENLAVVDENTGEVLVGSEEGTVTITASTNGDATHLSGTAIYTITINDPSLTKVTFDATIDIATDNAEGVTKSGINIITSHTDGVNDQSTPISYYQTFKNKTLTVTSTVGNIKKIDFITTGGASYSANGFAGVANEKWSGDASEIVLTASGNQVRMSKIIVSYIPDTRAEAGLAYAETAIEKHVGDEAFVNTLTNPNNLTVAYESSNTDVAEVAANGTVTIKAEGIATITASFEGNKDYKPASVSYELTVNEVGLENVTFDATSDYTADASTLTLSKGGFTLTFTSGAMNNKSEYRLYQGQTMTLSSSDYIIKKIEFVCSSGNPITGFADETGLDKTNNRWTGKANKIELTASNKQVRIEKMVVYYVEDTRAASGLAWSTDAVEITLGETFTAASLVNPNNIDAAEIVIESDNEDLATVNAGAVELEENVTGEATITATFAGNETYKPATISYTIKVNDPTPMIITNPTTYLNFGSKAQGATIDAKNLEVTLQNVAAATVAITGDGAAAFCATPMALTGSGTIVVSASSDNQGTFSATLTISDDAGKATAKEISLSLTVTEPVVEETAVSTTSKWVPAEAANLVDGAEVLITGMKDAVTYAMGADRGNNRFAVAGTLNEGVFTPGENTMSFTLVAQGDGTFAIRTSNGKYLYAGGTGNSNYLNTKAYAGELDANAKWNITISSIIATSTNRNDMRFNYNNNNPALISCYQSTSTNPAIALYVPQPAPTPVYETVRENLEPNRYYTVCLPKKMTEVRGASFWKIENRDNAGTMVYLEEVDPTEFAAGTPFIIQATATALEVVYTGSATTTAGTNGALHGTLTNMNAANLAAAGSNIYMLYQNELRPVGTNNHLDANRAYINYDELDPVTEAPASIPGRRVKSMPMVPQVATGVDQVPSDQVPNTKVLIDGQLYIMYNGTMYNVQGQLVK